MSKVRVLPDFIRHRLPVVSIPVEDDGMDDLKDLMDDLDEAARMFRKRAMIDVSETIYDFIENLPRRQEFTAIQELCMDMDDHLDDEQLRDVAMKIIQLFVSVPQ
jgi:hypothetical protein